MAVTELVGALIIGVIQGIIEWLPISSEGVVALVLAAMDFSPVRAVQLALFLHAGTALAATAYYRRDIQRYLRQLPTWRPDTAFSDRQATITFLAIATIVSGGVGYAGYRLLLETASELSGGLFIALIGGLLVVTGVVQRVADSTVIHEPELPRAIDAVIVGVGQGLAVLPGISRSGTTVSLLLLRGYDGETAFDLSFLLAIPASLGAGVLAFRDTGGLSGLSADSVILAFGASATVGFLTIGALLRVVQRVAFWGICIGFGGLAIIGGLIIIAL